MIFSLFRIHGNGTHVYMTVETNMIIYCEWNTECEKGYLDSLALLWRKFDSQIVPVLNI